MTQGTTVPQEKWLEFIPTVIDLGIQVIDGLSKEGYQLQSPSGEKVADTKDAAGREKWLQFIPLALSVGAQVYDALSKEGALPANKQVPLPKDISPQSTKGWLDFVPVVLNLGSQVLNAATKDGVVASGNGSPIPKLDDPDAKDWLDLLPVAFEIGTGIYDTLTKSPIGAAMPVRSLGAGPAVKEVVPVFSKQVLDAAKK